MGGHMGNARVTIANLEIVEVDEENNFIYLKGAVPGARGSLLMIQGNGDVQLIKGSQLESSTKDDEGQDVGSESSVGVKDKTEVGAEEQRSENESASSKTSNQSENSDNK